MRKDGLSVSPSPKKKLFPSLLLEDMMLDDEMNSVDRSAVGVPNPPRKSTKMRTTSYREHTTESGSSSIRPDMDKTKADQKRTNNVTESTSLNPNHVGFLRIVVTEEATTLTTKNNVLVTSSTSQGPDRNVSSSEMETGTTTEINLSISVNSEHFVIYFVFFLFFFF